MKNEMNFLFGRLPKTQMFSGHRKESYHSLEPTTDVTSLHVLKNMHDTSSILFNAFDKAGLRSAGCSSPLSYSAINSSKLL